MTLLIIVIALALIFDFINGFHDAANSIATVVSTKVLTPFQAVLWAAAFNFAAIFIFKDHGVANTVAKTVKEDYITLAVIMSGLIAAIFWNLLTWWYGIPSSSSHTLIGGFAGAAVAHAGFASIEPEPVLKTMSFIFLAPFVGMLMAILMSAWLVGSFKKGIQPKIISGLVIVAVILTIYTQLQTHPELSKIKTALKETEIAGIKQQAQSVPVYDETEAVVTKSWSEIETAFNTNPASNPKAARLDSMLRKVNAPQPLKIVSKIKSERADKTKLSVILINDSATVTGQNKAVDSVMALALDKFAKSTTSDAPIDFGKVLLAKENFKWELMGFILLSIAVFSLWLSSLNASRATKWFKRMQLLSSAAFSIGHGGNDAQKVMGIISVALIANGNITDFSQMPGWVPLACYTAIGLGTLSGGWRIIKTMGTKITKVTPFEGVAAETAGAVTLFLTENLKIPVSTTHTITGAIIGVGVSKRVSAVRWGVTVNLLWAWILTIPISALVGGCVYYVCTLCGLK